MRKEKETVNCFNFFLKVFLETIYLLLFFF